MTDGLWVWTFLAALWLVRCPHSQALIGRDWSVSMSQAWPWHGGANKMLHLTHRLIYCSASDIITTCGDNFEEIRKVLICATFFLISLFLDIKRFQCVSFSSSTTSPPYLPHWISKIKRILLTIQLQNSTPNTSIHLWSRLVIQSNNVVICFILCVPLKSYSNVGPQDFSDSPEAKIHFPLLDLTFRDLGLGLWTGPRACQLIPRPASPASNTRITSSCRALLLLLLKMIDRVMFLFSKKTD